jgi:hypothetical protein
MVLKNMKISLVCSLSTSTFWVSKYVVELETELNYYISNKLKHYDKLTYSFFMVIMYVDSTFVNSTIPRKLRHNKLKKYFEFTTKFVPNEFNKGNVLSMYERIIDELLIVLQNLKGDGDLHESLIQCIKDFKVSLDAVKD